MPIDLVPDVPAPPDAIRVFDWTQEGLGIAMRVFSATEREAYGFAVRIEGFQRENRTCQRWMSIDAGSFQTRLEPEAARQLASALTAAADEIEACDEH
jgi:hypothetical protein